MFTAQDSTRYEAQCQAQKELKPLTGFSFVLPISAAQHRDDHLLQLRCPGHDASPPVPLQQRHLRWRSSGQGALQRHHDITSPSSHSLHHRDHPQVQKATLCTLHPQGKNSGPCMSMVTEQLPPHRLLREVYFD